MVKILYEEEAYMSEEQKFVVTAGRDILGKLAPEFAKYNDDILFGEVWSDSTLNLKTRSMITVSTFHLQNAKKNGVSKKEMSAMITNVAFYAGWPKAWAAFNIIKDIYKD